MTRLGFFAMGALVIALGGACALPVLHQDPVHEHLYVAADSSDARGDSIVVQVREAPRSATISVLVWSVADPAYGLRASIARWDGLLVGGPRFGTHLVYMSPTLVRVMGGFRKAAIDPDRPLVASSPRRDEQACFYGAHCSPLASVGVWVDDAVLRAHGDSLVVNFYPQLGDGWSLTLDGELIARYLHTVDSVRLALRPQAAQD